MVEQLARRRTSARTQAAEPGLGVSVNATEANINYTIIEPFDCTHGKVELSLAIDGTVVRQYQDPFIASELCSGQGGDGSLTDAVTFEFDPAHQIRSYEVVANLTYENGVCAGSPGFPACQATRSGTIPAQTGCLDDGHCDPGFECVDGQCVPVDEGCAIDSECGECERCDAGECIPLNCGPNEVCENHRCRPVDDNGSNGGNGGGGTCSTDADCSGDNVCRDGVCVPPDGGGLFGLSQQGTLLAGGGLLLGAAALYLRDGNGGGRQPRRGRRRRRRSR